MFGLFDTVDSVLSDFNKKIERLKKIQSREAARAVDLEDEAAILLADARYAREEVERAGKLAAKLEKFVN
jgi:ssDNA-binding replication factor A large subunit